MRFLSDQDIYAVTVQFLRAMGHDVVTAADVAMSQCRAPRMQKSLKPRRKTSVSLSPATAISADSPLCNSVVEEYSTSA